VSKYKIGEVAKILGIPIDTLRYYERRGIVSPQKDEETGYRYYNDWDVNFLLDSKWYRGFGFSLSDVVHMINDDDHEAFIARCAAHELELLRGINEQKKKLDALAEYRHRVSQMKDHIGVFALCTRPPMVYQHHRYGYEFLFENDKTSSAQKWIDLMPYVDHTFLVQYFPGGYDGAHDNEHYWGFSLPPDDADKYGVELKAPAEYIRPVRSMYTVFSAEERGTFMRELHNKAADKVADMGYAVSGPLIGNLLVRLHEGGIFRRYFEVWVPIEQSKTL